MGIWFRLLLKCLSRRKKFVEESFKKKLTSMKMDDILVYVVKTNETLKRNILSSLENRKKKLTSKKLNDILSKLSLRQLIVL